MPTDSPAVKTVEAIDGVLAYKIDATDMRNLINQHPNLALALLAASAAKAERLFVAM